MSLNRLVDKIFIINLRNRGDKYSKMEEQLKKLGITNYERFDAIKPTLQMVKDEPLLVQLHNKTWNQAAMGVIGCKLSHIAVIKLDKEKC